MDIEHILTKKVGGVERSYYNIALNRSKGREYLNSMHPSEFEYYACAFELVDENNKRLEFFSFPVLPTSIQETKNSNANIKKTFGGTLIMNQSTFVPFDIMVSGNFGRKFRRVDYQSFAQTQNTEEAIETPVQNEDGSIETIQTQELSEVKVDNVFSSDYKTGYGSVKIIEAIFKRAQSTDINRKPLRLFFYNLSLNSNYLVEPVTITLSQTREQNMIWQYSLQMKAVAPAKYVFANFRSSLKELRSYNKKYVRMTARANILNELIKNVISGMSPTEAIMNQVNNYKAFGQQSAFKVLKRYTDNPLESVNFIKGKIL